MTTEQIANYELTERQKTVYQFIVEQMRLKQRSPSLREIGKQLGIGSTNGVMCHLKALERKGLIRRKGNISRGIEVLSVCREEILRNRIVKAAVEYYGGDCSYPDQSQMELIDAVRAYKSACTK